jgi:hypothetical protein
MAWFIASALLLFYLLGLFVFHGPTTLHVLPLLAFLFLIVDAIAARWLRNG